MPMTTSKTETIVATLAAINYRGLQRFQESIEELASAFEAKKVYNVVLDSAKQSIKNGVEAAAEVLVTAFRNSLTDAALDSARSKEWYWSIESYFNLNAASGKAKRLRKDCSQLLNRPAMADYLQLLDEVARINDMITALKPFVIKGRVPSETPKVADMTNTGACAICGAVQKLTRAKNLVHHGFQITDARGHNLGFRSGSCFGVDRKPYELSCEANKAYKSALEASLRRTNERLAELNSGSVESLPVRVQEWVGGHKKQTIQTVQVQDKPFAGVLKQEVYSYENKKAGLEAEIDFQVARIEQWSRTPLYDELHPSK